MRKGEKLRPGDRVEWNAHGGKTKPSGKAVGRVVKRVTSPVKIKRHVAKASPGNPQYIVESKRSGTQAAHKPAALRKRR